jgi:CubicO group peptidase (beta-lactamase class C family)
VEPCLDVIGPDLPVPLHRAESVILVQHAARALAIRRQPELRESPTLAGPDYPVSVERGSTIVYAKGFGYAQLPGSRFQPTTASRCASVSKPITGLCALVLADQGKLNLDAEVLPRHSLEHSFR